MMAKPVAVKSDLHHIILHLLPEVHPTWPLSHHALAQHKSAPEWRNGMGFNFTEEGIAPGKQIIGK